MGAGGPSLRDMAKLRSLSSGVPTLKPKVASDGAGLTRKEWLAQRDRNVEWRAWYRTARWEALRRRVFVRDGYVCRQTGELLSGKHPAPNSPVADHIKPHRGNPNLFWDETNIQTVSKQWHDTVKQAQERAEGIV